MAKTVLFLSFFATALMAGPARDLVLVNGATRYDVRALEALGALVNCCRPDGVIAEADAETQTTLRKMGYDVCIITPDITASYEANGADGRYLTYAEFRDTMITIAQNNPAICKLETLGLSYNNNLLLALKISDNPQVHENEPAVHFEGNIHGDEKIGWAVAFEMIKFLIRNYGADTLVTRLVNSREIWLHPMYNPDGYINASRYNGHNVDLNRNWGWMWGYESNRGAAPFSEPENRAVLSLILRRPAVMFVSFHAGTEFISYPWSCTQLETIPENRLISFLSQRYSIPTGYPYGQGSIGMYEINGSTKDFDYGQGMMGWSIEVHQQKTPPASEIDPTFNENRPAMLEFCHRAGQGIHGTVTDGVTGRPVECQIWVGPANWPSYNEATLGDFHRFYLPGTYSLTFRAPGYRETTLSNVVVPNSGDSSVTVHVQLTPDPAAPFFGFRVLYCDGNSSYTAAPDPVKALGPHDNITYPLTSGRRLCLDMGKTVRDMAGTDLVVYRPSGTGTATVKGANSWQGPWTTIGTANSNQTGLDLSLVGLDSIRYVELTASGTFNIDAVEGANYVPLAETPSSANPNRLAVIPNPASGLVRFLLDAPPDRSMPIFIFDAGGRLVQTIPARSTVAAWDTRAAPAGVYFCRFQNAQVQLLIVR
ncbi:MAG: M14 family zinc carboxypeptidase [candidate division WOR-3 bacterium]